jgi:DNA-binding NarL/FixJ family response regulator
MFESCRAHNRPKSAAAARSMTTSGAANDASGADTGARPGHSLFAMDRKRVVLVDDHPLIHQAVGQCLADTGDFEVVGVAGSGAQVSTLVARTAPDLVVLDLHLPVIDGLDCLAVLREKYPRVTVVMFSAAEDAELIEAALSAGAAAFVSKSIDLFDLPSVLRQALSPNVYFPLPAGVGGALTRRRHERAQAEIRDRTGLTERELEILEAVSRGLSNRAVGKELYLSDQTVKFHLHNIYGKLRVANRTEATASAHRLGLVAAPG